MGKPDKQATESSYPVLKRISKQLRTKINPLTKKVLAKCTNLNINSGKEFEEYKEIYALIQDIRELEKDHNVPLPTRSNWDEFFLWCKENGAQIEGVTVKEITQGNFGVVAEKDLKENDLYFTVPEKIIMSELSAARSKLGPIIKENAIMLNMPNVMLAIYLIMELIEENSFWKPYISILPTNFSTVLYFNIEEMELMQKAGIFSEAVNHCRSIARQYAYFQQYFQHNSMARALKIGDYFTFDLYRWAVSVIMTRQNLLPKPNSECLVAALIPLWDMCNHASGNPSSDFNLEKNCLEAYAMKDFCKGEEVFMFYGKRDNSNFFLHNGFVYLPNENDSFNLKLGISKSDLLILKKNELCIKNGLILDGSFTLQKNNPVDKNLLLFLKINVLKEEELISITENESLLFDESEKCKEITKRAYRYLKDRATLLLSCSKTSIEEDTEQLPSIANPRRQLIVELQISEKQMLQHIIAYCSGLLTT